MRILWDLVVQPIHAARARERAIDAKILSRYALIAGLANVRAGLGGIFRGAKLRSGIAES